MVVAAGASSGEWYSMARVENKDVASMHGEFFVGIEATYIHKGSLYSYKDCLLTFTMTDPMVISNLQRGSS